MCYSEIKWNIPTLVDFKAVTLIDCPYRIKHRYSKSHFLSLKHLPFDRRTILKRHRLFAACCLSLSLLFIWAQHLSVFSRTFIRSRLSLLFYFSLLLLLLLFVSPSLKSRWANFHPRAQILPSPQSRNSLYNWVSECHYLIHFVSCSSPPIHLPVNSFFLFSSLFPFLGE